MRKRSLALAWPRLPRLRPRLIEAELPEEWNQEEERFKLGRLEEIESPQEKAQRLSMGLEYKRLVL